MQYQNPLSELAQSHYARGMEENRLRKPGNWLELERSQQLLRRYLPPPPAVVVDVGGGTGVYAFWLAGLGYQVHLLDAMPLHIEQARQAASYQTNLPLASLAIGDARQLPQADGSLDAVLLMGPLYHLTEHDDRVKTWQEAYRVLRSGGVVVGVGISRFASLLDGMFKGFLDDPAFVEIVRQGLAGGQHRNPANHPAYFTTAYFHHPTELAQELTEAGFHHEQTLAVEGPAWLSAYVENNWNDPAKRQMILDFLVQLENEPSLLGVSSHIMSIGRK